jgi:hypothetical protein
VEMNGNRNGCEPKGLDRYDLVMAVDGKWKNGKCRARPKRASVGKTKADADGADLTSDGLWFTVCGLRFAAPEGFVRGRWLTVEWGRQRQARHGTAWARLLGRVRCTPLLIR